MWFWRPRYHIPDDKWWWWWWLWWWWWPSCLLPIEAGSHCWKIWHEGLELGFFHAPWLQWVLDRRNLLLVHQRHCPKRVRLHRFFTKLSEPFNKPESDLLCEILKKQTKQIMLNWSPAQHGDRHHPSDGDHPRESLRGQSLVLRDLQPPYLCNWQQAWDVVRKYFAFWSCEILTLLCILVYCSRSTPAHWVLALSDRNGRTWLRSGGWFFLKFHNKLFKVM